MNVELLSYKENVPSFGWHFKEAYNRPIEYTGRWKITTTNGKSELYLECFELVLEVYEVRGTFFRSLVKKDSQVFKKLKIKPLGWIHESELTIEVTEEFINECGSNG